MDSKYWDQIYKNKTEQDISWFQSTPTKSLEMIGELNLTYDVGIIDIGGGDSR